MWISWALPCRTRRRSQATCTDPDRPRTDMQPLFDAIVDAAPPVTGDRDALLRILVVALGYNNKLGSRCGTGKMATYTWSIGCPLAA